MRALRKGSGILPRADARSVTALALAMLLWGLFLAGSILPASIPVNAAPDEGGRVPYAYHLESLLDTSGGGTALTVFRDQELALGQSIEATGWLATAEGVQGYQYLWLPAGGGNALWHPIADAAILPRGDLASAGVDYPSGHGTAGFQLTITPPDGTTEGYYDVYIRALDGMGTPCDLAALLNLRYGEPDRISQSAREISLPRIGREGDTSLLRGAVVEGETLRLSPDASARLGSLNLTPFEEARISYYIPDSHALEGERVPILGLKTAGLHSYGEGDAAYNVTDSLVYAPLRERTGEVTLDLTAQDADGELWLTGHLYGDVIITKIELIYNGYGTDRVAARIHLGAEAVRGYLNGYNHTEALTVTDPTLGDVLRLQVTAETNDPFAFFDAGGLLREHDLALDADEYKYMVFLYRADPANNSDRMNLYLCAGPITGATEDCNQGASLQNDGKWHYLLVDLTQKENWGGIINGWRFDYISASGDPGDGVEFARVQFFRTAKAAHSLADSDPLSAAPYCAGDPVILRDMSEETAEEEDFVLNPADTYEVLPPEPPTEPSEETPEPPAEPVPPAGDAASPEGDTSADIRPQGGSGGCASAAPLFLLPSLTAALWSVTRRKTYCTQRRSS